MRSTQYGQFLTSTQLSYLEKISHHKTVGSEYETQMKDLEKYEQQMLAKLQTTMSREQAEIRKLQQVKAIKVTTALIYKDDHYQEMD